MSFAAVSVAPPEAFRVHTLRAAGQPTLYFIGMTTARSSIMRVFPRWADYLGLGAVGIRGIDCRWHDEPKTYRRIVEFIRDDPLSRGALVTTHKIDLLHACRDLFAGLDEYAQTMGEVSCIAKRDGKLFGSAKDPISSGLALEAFLPPRYWANTGAEVFVMGAGGSAIAITNYLMAPVRGANRPARIVVSNRSPGRLAEIAALHQSAGATVPVEYRCTPQAAENDAILAGLRPHSLVINATGLGKDAPGSPLTSAARFPMHGWAWDFNYRGELEFLRQARAQSVARQLGVVDGWVYFLHGWTQVVADVFGREIPPDGEVFARLAQMALEVR
jgi:shikimate 5-dehydrogenase